VGPREDSQELLLPCQTATSQGGFPGVAAAIVKLPRPRTGLIPCSWEYRKDLSNGADTAFCVQQRVDIVGRRCGPGLIHVFLRQ